MNPMVIGLFSLLLAAAGSGVAHANLLQPLENGEIKTVRELNNALEKASKSAPYRVQVQWIEVVDSRLHNLKTKNGEFAWNVAYRLAEGADRGILRTPIIPRDPFEERIFVRDSGGEMFWLFQASQDLTPSIKLCLRKAARETFALLKELNVPKEALDRVVFSPRVYRDRWQEPEDVRITLNTDVNWKLPELEVEFVVKQDQSCHIPTFKWVRERLSQLESPISSEELLEELLNPKPAVPSPSAITEGEKKTLPAESAAPSAAPVSPPASAASGR